MANTYLSVTFKDKDAAKEIGDALPPDAVVIIRGDDAVNDLAWLKDYDLARLICDLPIR